MYDGGQAHDSIALYRLSKQGIYDNAAALYGKGASLGAIARELSIPKSTVRQTLLDGGVALRLHSRRQARSLVVPSQVSIRTAPYGFCVIEGRLVEDPKEASVVRLIMTWWRQGMSHCAITRRLNNQRIKPRKAATLAVLAVSTGQLSRIERTIRMTQIHLIQDSQASEWGQATLLLETK